MKSKLLFLSFLMLLTVTTNYSQTSASSAGIAIQGIARDANNSAIKNQNVQFLFELYFQNQTPFWNKTETISTDSFGVFSYVLDIDATQNSTFANNEVWLKISTGGTTISDEVFKHVPYAVAANNGVPTGSIMPFIGTVAPPGWVLCDGSPLPTNASVLKALLGGANNAPDLQGMFLRGTGTNNNATYANNVGPALNQTQVDGFKEHLHDNGDLSNSTAGNHAHQNKLLGVTGAINTAYTDTPFLQGSNGFDGNHNTNSDGDHTHTITGSTGLTGILETRPVNYGVNYIIKL